MVNSAEATLAEHIVDFQLILVQLRLQLALHLHHGGGHRRARRLHIAAARRDRRQRAVGGVGRTQRMADARRLRGAVQAGERERAACGGVGVGVRRSGCGLGIARGLEAVSVHVVYKVEVAVRRGLFAAALADEEQSERADDDCRTDCARRQRCAHRALRGAQACMR